MAATTTLADYWRAKDALEANNEADRKAGIYTETPRYLALNQVVGDAYDGLSRTDKFKAGLGIRK